MKQKDHRTNILPMKKGPMKDVMEKCDNDVCEDDILYIIYVHGFPYSNIDECGVAVVTIAENNIDKV